jgi:hypothetical protein
VDAELHERALVDQERDALTGRQLALPVLAGDALLAASQAGALAPLVQVLDERAQRGPRDQRSRRCPLGGGQIFVQSLEDIVLAATEEERWRAGTGSCFSGRTSPSAVATSPP